MEFGPLTLRSLLVIIALKIVAKAMLDPTDLRALARTVVFSPVDIF